MNIKKTIENIQKTCDSYVDPELVGIIINQDNYMGSNNIEEISDYGIEKSDSYSEKVLKVLKYEKVFLNLGLITFAPFINECDIYSTKDYNLKLSEEEFKKYAHLKDKYFGILIDNDSYSIGICDICGCKVDSSFKELEKSDDAFFNKLNEIANEKILKD